MWSDKNSIVLSQVSVVLFGAALLAVVVWAPRLVEWLVGFSRAELAGQEPFFYVTIYVGALPAVLMLYSLHKLLDNIGASRVFTADNVAHLRRISWSCFFGALVSFISVQYYFPWILVSIAAGFMGLIVRVVKNLLAQGVVLKQDADLTV